MFDITEKDFFLCSIALSHTSFNAKKVTWSDISTHDGLKSTLQKYNLIFSQIFRVSQLSESTFVISTTPQCIPPQPPKYTSESSLLPADWKLAEVASDVFDWLLLERRNSW